MSTPLLGCTGGGGLFLKAAVVLGTLTKLPIELEVFVRDGREGGFESEGRFGRTVACIGPPRAADFFGDACAS